MTNIKEFSINPILSTSRYNFIVSLNKYNIPTKIKIFKELSFYKKRFKGAHYLDSCIYHTSSADEMNYLDKIQGNVNFNFNNEEIISRIEDEKGMMFIRC